MIAALRGTLQAIEKDAVIIETGGIGFLVYVPRPVLHNLGQPGAEVSLHTWLLVREDALTLYGFATVAQRALFEILLSVTGVGPRVALAILSDATPDEVRQAVAQKNTARFARVSGIGKKLAERLVLELRGKLDMTDLPSAPDAPPETLAVNTELIDLLESLGYSQAEAQEAVAALPGDAPTDLEERLRLALRYFGSA